MDSTGHAHVVLCTLVCAAGDALVGVKSSCQIGPSVLGDGGCGPGQGEQ